MSVDDCLIEITDRGWSLRYLRQCENGRKWEAMLARPAFAESYEGNKFISFHVGFNSGRSPVAALLSALNTAESSSSLETCALQPASIEKPGKLSLATMMKDLVPMANQFKLTRKLL